MTEELEEKTAQIEKLEDSLTADEPALSTEISELGSLQTNLEVAKKQIIILETKLANLQNRNKIIIDSLKSVGMFHSLWLQSDY